MSPEQAIVAIRGYAAAGRIVVAGHALQRMRQRNVTFRDIRCALTSANACEATGPKWKVTGPDVDVENLTCVVAIEGGVVVVTVF